MDEKDRRRLKELRDFWSDHTSTRRFLAEMDPEDKIYMVTGGVTDGRTLDLEGQPHAASALQRVAGIFLDYEKLLSLGLPGLHRLVDEKKEAPGK